MHYMLVITHLLRIINNKIMEAETMNFTACDFTQKLVC